MNLIMCVVDKSSVTSPYLTSPAFGVSVIMTIIMAPVLDLLS